MNEIDNLTTSGQLGPKWPTDDILPRELTREERAGIRKLVVRMCANYDDEYGCLPLDCPCVMLHKWWTGGGCRYFSNAVLPLDSILEASLSGGAVETQTCVICGGTFPISGKQAYCSAACAGAARKKRQREYMRKKREYR